MSKILDFVKRRNNYFALGLLCLFFLVSFFSVQGKFWEGLKFQGSAITSDEASHIPAGFYYLKTRQYFINAEHPPLIKNIAALPLLFLNPKLPEIPEHQKYENIQWDFASAFLFDSGNNPDQILFWSRTIILLLNTLLLFLVFYFLKKVFGVFPALISLFFLTFSPNVVGHGSLVVFDVPLALFSVISILTFSLFLKNLTIAGKFRKNLILASLFTSLALLTKFQAVFLFPALFFGGLIYILINKKELWKKYLFLFAIFSILILIIAGLVGGFQVSRVSSEGMKHQLGYSYPDFFPEFGKAFLNKILSLGFFFFNGLVEYLIGIFMVISRVKGAFQTTYFMGGVFGGEGAGPLYFPILFLTKEALGFLIILSLAVFFSIAAFFRKNDMKQKIADFFKNPFFVLCFFFFLIYGFFSLTMKLNIGLRHIFPLTFLVYILTARQIGKYLSKKIFLVFLPLFFLVIYSFVSVFPYYLSFYNIFGGGLWQGYQIATDSNYDWGGQDVKRLAIWLKQNKIEKIYTHIFSNAPLKYYLGQGQEHFNIASQAPLPPSGSYLAVSAFELQNINYNKGLPESKKYFQFKDNFVKRIGTTIFVFKLR